jgi:hypothetical protein
MEVTVHPCTIPYDSAMAFRIFRQLEDGEMLLIAARDSREEADKLVREIREAWPGVCEIKQMECTAPEQPRLGPRTKPKQS